MDGWIDLQIRFGRDGAGEKLIDCFFLLLQSSQCVHAYRQTVRKITSTNNLNE